MLNTLSKYAKYVSIEVKSCSNSPNLQNKVVTPFNNEQIILPDEQFDGLSSVTVGSIPSDYTKKFGYVTGIDANSGTYDYQSNFEFWKPDLKHVYKYELSTHVFDNYISNMKGYYVGISRNIPSSTALISINGFNPATVSVNYYYFTCVIGLVLNDSRGDNSYYYPFYCEVSPTSSTLQKWTIYFRFSQISYSIFQLFQQQSESYIAFTYGIYL